MARMVMNVTPKTPQPYGKGDLASAESGRESRREPPPPIPPWRGGPSRSAAEDRLLAQQARGGDSGATGRNGARVQPCSTGPHPARAAARVGPPLRGGIRRPAPLPRWKAEALRP